MRNGLQGIGRLTGFWRVAAVVWSIGLLGGFAYLAFSSFERAAYAQAPDFADGAADAGAAAAPAAAPAAGQPAAGGGGAPATKPGQSRLVWMYQALGLFYTIVFLSLSFTFVALLVMNLLMSRRDQIVPLSLVEAFEAHLNEKRYQDAYELAKTDDSMLGHVLAAGLAKLQGGYDKAMAAMQEVGEEENMRLEHRLSYIALVGVLSPMIGLLGTVDGMIRSFDVIANSPTQPKPSELASGISTALFTTLIGLWLAIPAIAAYNILKNRVSRLVLEAGIISEGLMSRFEAVGTRK